MNPPTSLGNSRSLKSKVKSCKYVSVHCFSKGRSFRYPNNECLQISKRSPEGKKGFIISLALGAAAAGPLYAAFPVAVVMRNKGSSLFNIFVFLGAWSTAKIPLLTFEAANLGMKFMISRLCLSLIGIVVIAMLVNLTVNEADLPILDE